MPTKSHNKVQSSESPQIKAKNYQELFDLSLKNITDKKNSTFILLTALNEFLEKMKNSDEYSLLEDFTQEKEKSEIDTIILASAVETLQSELFNAKNLYEEVLALITHEFKNLFTTLNGYNRILEKRLKKKEHKESFEVVKSSQRIINKLNGIVSSLLKISLAEKGVLTPELNLIDINSDLLNPLEIELAPKLQNKKMNIVKILKPDKIMLMADANLLEIVMWNLVENAIKYGLEGSDINISVIEQEDKIHISVKNEGPGIPQKISKNLFEKFRSAQVGKTKGGTGIGLFNVKNIVNIHHGNINCISKPDQWTEFNINLPKNMK